MRTDPRQYEILYILSSQFSKDELEQGHAFVKSVLKENEATITLEEDWGKKELSYQIKGVKNGYYRLVQFDMKPAQFNALNEKLRLSHLVLRYIIVKAEEYTPGPRPETADGQTPKKQRYSPKKR